MYLHVPLIALLAIRFARLNHPCHKRYTHNKKEKITTKTNQISSLYNNAKVYNVYHRHLCFISDQATMAQEQKSL